jgi:hypothetical protein
VCATERAFAPGHAPGRRRNARPQNRRCSASAGDAAGQKNEGTTKLYVNDEVVAEGKMRTQPAKFTLSGDGLCVGWDSGDAVSELYKSPGRFKGGTIQAVAIDLGKQS